MFLCTIKLNLQIIYQFIGERVEHMFLNPIMVELLLLLILDQEDHKHRINEAEEFVVDEDLDMVVLTIENI